MVQRIIKVFLASSIIDLKEDRIYLGDFFNTLNNIFEKNNLFFKLIKCENYDNAIALSGKQAQYDEEIRSSELCYFLFLKKVGDFTKHEFEVAMESYRVNHKPKVVTYIKYVESLENMQPEVKQHIDMLESKLHHYYNVYNHIDTLKMKLLLQILCMEELGLGSSVLDINNGEISLNGELVTTCESIPMFAGNADYIALKEEYQQVEAEYLRVKDQFLLDSENPEIQIAYSAIMRKRAKLIKHVEQKEKQLLECMKEVTKKTSEGNLSARQISGYRLVEQGKYEEALQILDKDEIFLRN